MSARIGRRDFGTSILLLAAVGIGVFSKRLLTRRDSGELPSGSPPIRQEPLAIPPQTGLEDLVPDARLVDLLVNLAPSWYSFKTGRVLHAFRLWGPEAEFPRSKFVHSSEQRIFSGSELMAHLLDTRAYRRNLPGEEPLLAMTPSGVSARTLPGAMEGNFAGALGHVDDLLTACAEVGLPSETPVYTPGGEASVADMLRDSIARFDLRQELEWTTEAFARYLAPAKRWENRFGESFTFDDLALALMQPRPTSACIATHVPYALVCLLRIDEIENILEQSTRSQIASFLEQVSQALVASRQAGSYWAPPEVPLAQGTEQDRLYAESKLLTDAVLYSGHHLEWIALAPEALRPSRKAIGDAINGIFAVLDEIKLTANGRTDWYLPLSHLARALCLMKNQTPVELVNSGISQKQ